MRQVTHTLTSETNGPGLYEITNRVVDWCQQQSMQKGLLTLFIRHTSASLTIQENTDPDVCHDLQVFFDRIAPQHGSYRHSAEGPDDMSAHVRSILTQSDLNIPVRDGRCALGTWQGVYLWEHRTAPHERCVIVTVQGE